MPTEMKVTLNEKDDIVINSWDLIEHLVNGCNEDQLNELIGYFGWSDAIFHMTTKALAEQYSSPVWNPNIHKEGKLFLEK